MIFSQRSFTLIKLRAVLVATLLLAVSVFTEVFVHARIYQQEQDDESIATLRSVVKRNKNDLRAWHYLGLALEKQGNTKEARKAHEKAALLGDELLAQTLDELPRELDFGRVLRPIGSRLTEASASAVRFIQLEPKLSRSMHEEWSQRTEALLAFADIANSDPKTQTVFRSKEVDVKARILNKPPPQYSEAARQDQVTGTVILFAILTADGKVTAIHPLKSRPRGLTEQAIKAARQITFIPAMKNGKPVSMSIQLEYNFNLY